MKRSGPPARRAPLLPDPDQVRAWRDRSRRPLPQRSAKRQRIEAEVRPDVIVAVWARAGGRCEYAAIIPEVPCGSPWPHRPVLEVDELHGGSARATEMQDPDQCALTCQVHHDVKTDGRWFGDVWVGKRVVLERWAARPRGDHATP